MKNIYTLLLFLSFTFSSISQNRLAVIFGPTVGGSQSQNIDTLFATYNQYYSSKMAKGFSKSMNPSGFTIMGSYSGAYGVVETNFGFGHVWGKNSFTYTNGDQRIISFSQREFITDLTIGTNEESPIFIHGNLGLTYRGATTNIYYKHANGLKEYNIMLAEDYSRDYLNGAYESWRLSFYAGFGIGTNLNDEGLRIVLRGDYNFRGESFLGGSLIDHQGAKSGIGIGKEWLPKNLVSYYETGYLTSGNYNKNDSYGMRWTLAITVPLLDF